MASLANDPILWGRSIGSFRHLECQNLSIISDSIGIPRWLQKKAKKSEEEEESYSLGWSENPIYAQITYGGISKYVSYNEEKGITLFFQKTFGKLFHNLIYFN